MQQPLSSEIALSQQGDIFLHQLKERTASMHRALEQLPLSVSLTSPAISRTDYEKYLLRMLPVVQDLEANIYPLLQPVVPDLAQRRKLPLLLADLEYLQVETPDTPARPLSLAAKDMSVPFAMGIMYVMEGSTLGGRFIGNNIQKTLGYTQETGARYFGGYGPTTGSMWKSFLQQLNHLQASGDTGHEIIDGANFAFSNIYNHFKG